MDSQLDLFGLLEEQVVTETIKYEDTIVENNEIENNNNEAEEIDQVVEEEDLLYYKGIKKLKANSNQEHLDFNCVCTFPWDESRVIELKDALIIGLKEEEKLNYLGGIKLCVLKGMIQVNGYKMKHDKDNFYYKECYNSKTQAILSVQSIIEQEDKIEEKEDIILFKKDRLQPKKSKSSNGKVLTVNQIEEINHNLKSFPLEEFDSVIYCSKLNNQFLKLQNLDPNFTTMFISQNYINAPFLGFYPLKTAESGLTSLTISDDWQQAVKKFVKFCDDYVHYRHEEVPIIMIVGNKNFGKSTLSKYLINNLLNNLDSVAFINADPGQSDFTPSGLISFHLIDKPILGPTFTELRYTENSYYIGDNQTKSCPTHYIDSIIELFQTYKLIKEKRIPLIINTNGWIKALGLDMINQINKICQPNFILEITDKQEQLIKSFNENINYIKVQPNIINKDPSFIPFYSKYAAETFRNLNLSSYLIKSKIHFNEWDLQFKLNEVKPYVMNINDLEFYLLDGQITISQLFSTLNLALVGLYKIKKEFKINNNNNNDALLPPKLINHNHLPYPPPKYYNCLGIGLIRSIDIKLGKLYIISNLNLEIMSSITTIVKGSINLPNHHLYEDSIWSRNQNKSLAAPYLSFNNNKLIGRTSISASRKRLVRKRALNRV